MNELEQMEPAKTAFPWILDAVNSSRARVCVCVCNRESYCVCVSKEHLEQLNNITHDITTNKPNWEECYYN